jgi:hypothetical protein
MGAVARSACWEAAGELGNEKAPVISDEGGLGLIVYVTVSRFS